MKGKWKKISRRALSLILSASMFMSAGQGVLQAHALEGQGTEELKVLEASRIAGEKLPQGNIIYFGTASAQVEERGVYGLQLYREGSLDKEASVEVRTIDMTALYGEDYEILMEGVEAIGDGKTILEKQFQGKEIVPEKFESQTGTADSSKQPEADAKNDADTAGIQIAQENPEGQKTAATASSLAKAKEEQTRHGTRPLAEGSDKPGQDIVDALMEGMVTDSMECLDASSSFLVKFAPGEGEKLLKFKILEDDKSEGTENFSFLLTNPQGAKAYEVTSASVAIQDDEESVRSEVSFTEPVYQSKEGRAMLTVKREGAEYSVCDMNIYTSGDTAKAGENYAEVYEVLTFSPYEMEKEIEIPVTGDGKFHVFLSDFKACTPGVHSKTEVSITREEARGAESNGSSEGGKNAESEACLQADSKLRASSDDTNSFGVSMKDNAGNDKAYTVEYRMKEKTGRIMDNSYSPAVEAGTYYFSADSAHGGIFSYNDSYRFGSKPFGFGHWESSYHFNKDAADRMDNFHFGKLEYYHTSTGAQGGATAESAKEIPGVYYQYFVNDWRSKSGDFGGQRAKLEMIANGNSGKLSVVDGKFDRSQNKAPVKNTDNGILKAKIWSVDEYKSKTPKNYIEFYGLCAMYKKFNVSLQPIAQKKFRTGTSDSYLNAEPVQMQLKCGAQVLYDNESRDVYANPDERQSNLVFTVQDTQLGGYSGKYGHITGYDITIDPGDDDKRVTVHYPKDFISWLNGKKGKTNANDSVNFSAAAVESEIKKVNASIDTVPYDGYFIYWIDSVQKDTIQDGHGYKQKLKFKPLIEYNNVTVEVLSPKGQGKGRFTDAQLSKNGTYNFHAGDQLDLSAVADNPDHYHVAGYEVSVNGGVTYNAYTDDSFLMLETGNKYLIRPIIMENTNAIEVRFQGKAGEKFEIQGLIDKKKLESFPEYKGKHILNLNPKGKTVQEMMKPSPGKEYTVRIAVKGKESGSISRPQVKLKSKNTVYTTQAFTMVAAADAEDNIVEIGLKTVKESEIHEYQISGNLVSSSTPIRSTGTEEEELPVSNYTLSVGTGTQRKDAQTGDILIESVSSSTNDKGAYNLLGIKGCKGDVIPVLISNGMANGQVVDVTLTDSLPVSDGRYQVTRGNTKLLYPYDMPKVTSINYNYDNSVHNQSTDNRDNSIRLYDDTLTITAKVNPAHRKVKEAVFTVYTVTGASTEYRVKESENNKNTFECKIPKMLENLHNGDRVKVRLIDQEVKMAESGETIYDEDGQEITGLPVEMQYPDVDTGLVFYIENMLLAPQTYDMANCQPVNVPLLGATSANANSGLITFGKLEWANATGYTYHVGIDALISSMAAPNTTQKLAKMNKFITDVGDVSSGKSKTTSEDIMYKNYKDDANATLQKASLKEEKAEVDKMVKKTKEAPTSSSKKAQAGLNSDALMSVDVGFLMAISFVYDPVRQEYIYAEAAVSVGGTFTFNKTMYAVIECVPLFLNITGTVQVGAAAAHPSEDGQKAMTAGDFDAYSGNIADHLSKTTSSLTLMLSGKVQAGVGLCGIVSARGYASMKLQFDVGITNASSGALISATGGIGFDLLILSVNVDLATVKLGFGTLGNKAEFDFFGGLYGIDMDLKLNSKNTPFQLGNAAGEKKVIKDYEQGRQLTMQGYSAGTSDMSGFGGPPNMHRATLEQISVTTLLDNAAERTRPRIIPLDGGKKMLVFIGNQGKGDVINSMALYYSIYDGVQWSKPDIVSLDGTLDSMPDIYRVGNKVLIAWADAGRSFTAADTPMEKLSSMGISMAVYDIPTGKMGEEVSLVKDDGYMNLSPHLNVDGTTVYCSYMKRDLTNAKEEDLLDFQKIYSTMAYVSYNYETQQKQKETFIEIIHETMADPLVMDYTSVVTGVDGDSYMVSTYTIDEDEDLNTGDDKELYLELYNLTKNRNYNPIRITRDSISQSAPKLTDIGGTVYLTWLDSGYVFRLMDVSELLEALFDTSKSSITVVQDDGTEKIVTIDKNKFLDGYVQANTNHKDWYKKSARELGVEERYYQDSIYEALAQENFQADSANLAQTEGVTTSISNYKLATNGDDIYIFFTDFGQDETSTGVEIYGARYERMLEPEGNGSEKDVDEAWGFGKAVQITNNGKVIDELDLYMTEDSRVSAVSNYFDQWIDQEGNIQYGVNQLVEIEFGTTNSLTVKDDLVTLPPYLIAGETDQITFEVQNHGLLDASGFDYAITWVSDGKETVIEKNHVDVVLAAGESTEVIVPWKVPKNVADSSVRVAITENGVDHGKPVVVQKQVPYGSNVRFTEVQALWKGKEPYIQATISNIGNALSEKYQGMVSEMKPVTADGQLRKEEGKTYANFEIPALASGEEKTIEIPFIPALEDYSSQGIIDLKITAQDGKEEIADSYVKLVSIRPVCAQINNGEKNLKLTVGKKVALKVKAAPWNEIAGQAVFYSSNEKVAVVDSKGTVIGISPGIANVYAYYSNTGVTASIQTEVTAAESESKPKPKDGTKKIKTSKNSTIVAAGKTKKIKYTAEAETGAKAKAVTVSVSGNKKVKAKLSGSYVKITANKKAVKGSSAKVVLKSKTASGKTIKSVIKVRIQNKVKKLSADKKAVEVKKGKTAKITLKVSEENKKYATTDEVKISSNLVKLTKVSVKKKKITLVLKGKKKGKKTITIQVGKKKVRMKAKVR